MLKTFCIPLLLFALLGFNLSLVVDAQELVLKYEPQVGQAHPDFALPRIDDGKPLMLSQLRGKKVLLLHFASW